MDFASILKYLRIEKGLTQAELAKETGLSYHSINSYESGRRTPNAKAVVALEKYFQVSGEYLRGESNERLPVYKWDDPEVAEAVKETLPALLQNLNKITRDRSPQEQKLFFDVLVELFHVLKLEDQKARAVSISLLQDAFTASTRFIDVCLGAGNGIDAPARLDKAKTDALSHFEQALMEAQKFLSF